MFDLITALQAICVDESRKFSQREHAYLLMLSLIQTYKPENPRKPKTLNGFPILNNYEVDLGRYTGKIDCVRAYKLRTGLSLIDAKRTCEAYFDANGYTFKSHN